MLGGAAGPDGHVKLTALLNRNRNTLGELVKFVIVFVMQAACPLVEKFQSCTLSKGDQEF